MVLYKIPLDGIPGEVKYVMGKPKRSVTTLCDGVGTIHKTARHMPQPTCKTSGGIAPGSFKGAGVVLSGEVPVKKNKQPGPPVCLKSVQIENPPLPSQLRL